MHELSVDSEVTFRKVLGSAEILPTRPGIWSVWGYLAHGYIVGPVAVLGRGRGASPPLFVQPLPPVFPPTTYYWDGRHNVRDINRPTSDCRCHLQDTVYTMPAAFPDILLCFRVALTLPVASATAERSFSAMKRIKTHLRAPCVTVRQQTQQPGTDCRWTWTEWEAPKRSFQSHWWVRKLQQSSN